MQPTAYTRKVKQQGFPQPQPLQDQFVILAGYLVAANFWQTDKAILVVGGASWSFTDTLVLSPVSYWSFPELWVSSRTGMLNKRWVEFA